MGRKSLSIKRISKENNSDFSLSQLNDKFTQKILKNNEEGNDIGNYAINNKQNINKTIKEDIDLRTKKNLFGAMVKKYRKVIQKFQNKKKK